MPKRGQKPSRSDKRVARKLSDHWDIQYVEALRTLRDTKQLPECSDTINKLQEDGLTYPEALFQLCIDSWQFE